MAPPAAWNRVGLGPKTRPRSRPQIRIRPSVFSALAVFFFLWLVLPYDNAARLAFRWNAKRLKAALFSRSSERWVYAPPEHPVDLGQDLVVIVKTGYGTRERVPAWLDALSDANEFRDILVIADSEGHIDFNDGHHENGLHVHDAVGHSLRLHLGRYKDHPRVAKYNLLTEAIFNNNEALAQNHCRAFGWELDAMKVQFPLYISVSWLLTNG